MKNDTNAFLDAVYANAEARALKRLEKLSAEVQATGDDRKAMAAIREAEKLLKLRRQREVAAAT